MPLLRLAVTNSVWDILRVLVTRQTVVDWVTIPQTDRIVTAYRESKQPATSSGNEAYAYKTWIPTYRTVRCNTREDRNVNLQPRENLISDLGQCIRFQAFFMKPQWKRNNAFRLHVCTVHQQYQNTFLLFQLMHTIIKSQEC